jgi:hypothetical protein
LSCLGFWMVLKKTGIKTTPHGEYHESGMLN